MIGYPYIEQLFGAILQQSYAINGRFYMCPYWGAEITYANVAEAVMAALPQEPKYPCAILMPPRKTGSFQYSSDFTGVPATGYSYYDINMAFLRPATYTAYNQVSQPMGGTGAAAMGSHTIPETWHDMDRCAVAFMRVLQQVLQHHVVAGVIISEKERQAIWPVTNIGNDKVCGVMLHFALGLDSGCEVEDYPEDFIGQVRLPAFTDIHPQHPNT